MRSKTTAGDVNTQVGMASHVYLVTESMVDANFYSADFEMLVVPQEGRLRFCTELGAVEVEPQEIAILPRGLVYHVEVLEGPCRGFVCENYGQKFELPSRGPIGANCRANPRDFVNSTYAPAARVAFKGGSLKDAWDAVRAKCDPKFADYAIYEHCLPVIVARAYDEARGIHHPRIWAPKRDLVMVGGGPVGIGLALDLGKKGVACLVLDDHDGVGMGSRAICFAKGTLEICDRLGCADPMICKGFVWSVGRVYRDEREVNNFDLLPEDGHKHPAFINLQQPYFEQFFFE